MSARAGTQSAQREAKIRRLAEKSLDDQHDIGSYDKGPRRDQMDRLRGLLVAAKDGPLTVDLAHQCHAAIREEIVDMVTRLGCVFPSSCEILNELQNFIGIERATQPWTG